MSESEVGGVRRGYEAPRACIVAVGPGCVVRASGWTTTQFDWQGDVEYGGLWGGDNSSSASAFQWQNGDTPESGLWGGVNSSSASAFEEDTGRW